MIFIMLRPLRRICNAILFEIPFNLAVRIVFNFGNGVRYHRVPWVITHVIVDGDFYLADLVQHSVCTQIGLNYENFR